MIGARGYANVRYAPSIDSFFCRKMKIPTTENKVFIPSTKLENTNTDSNVELMIKRNAKEL
jgi:hypothetical protein